MQVNNSADVNKLSLSASHFMKGVINNPKKSFHSSSVMLPLPSTSMRLTTDLIYPLVIPLLISIFET